MEAVLRIQSSEFTDELIEKIKALVRGKEHSEITISITESASRGILRKETREEYFERFEDLAQWARTDPKLVKKVFELIADVHKHPFKGLGKPEG